MHCRTDRHSSTKLANSSGVGRPITLDTHTQRQKTPTSSDRYVEGTSRSTVHASAITRSCSQQDNCIDSENASFWFSNALKVIYGRQPMRPIQEGSFEWTDELAIERMHGRIGLRIDSW